MENDEKPSLDVRASEGEVRHMWESCARCELGPGRATRKEPLFYGEGASNAIMVVGQAPGRDEVWGEQVYTAREDTRGDTVRISEGALVRDTISALKLDEHVYLTYSVACRSAGFRYSNDNTIRMSERTGKPIIGDRVPKQAELEACQPRLHQQVYRVDPVVIIAMGQTALESLSGRAQTVANRYGEVLEIELPGQGRLPVLTEKKRAWFRKVRGVTVAPTEQSAVRYLVVICPHPWAALEAKHLNSTKNEFTDFMLAFARARDIYNEHHKIMRGVPVLRET